MSFLSNSITVSRETASLSYECRHPASPGIQPDIFQIVQNKTSVYCLEDRRTNTHKTRWNAKGGDSPCHFSGVWIIMDYGHFRSAIAV